MTRKYSDFSNFVNDACNFNVNVAETNDAPFQYDVLRNNRGIKCMNM